MKKIRLLLIILLLSVICQMPVAAKETEPLNTESFRAMKAMELLTDDFLNMNSGSPVTRAQFMGALYKLTGASEANNGITLPFEDVTGDTPYRNAIAYFYTIGAVSGSGNGMFVPDGKITYAQAVKVACDFLGYGIYVQQSLGGYPDGYLTMASKLNLCEGIILAGTNEPMNAESVVRLLYNTANAYVAEAVEYDKNGSVVSYAVSKDSTPLTLYNNIHYDEGVLKDNGVVSLTGNDSAADTVVIDEKKYKAPNTDLTDYLGMELSFFYKASAKEDEVLWVYPTNHNNILTITADELIKNDSAYSTSTVVYYKNDRRKTADIDDFADIVYNNTLTNNATAAYLKPCSGEIRLIDNNGDKDYDIVIVKEYRNIFVNAVSVEKEFITDQYGETIDLSMYNNIKVFDENGEAAQLSEIAPDRVVSYLASPDSKDNIYLYINSAGKTAALEAVEEGEEIIYTFDGIDLKAAQSLYDVIAAGRYYVPQLEAGRRYVYFTDIEGKIAAVKNASDTEQYAYFIGAKHDDAGFAGNEHYAVKMLLSDGITTVADTAKNYKITGYDDGIALEDKSSQVVKVLFDSDGCIKEMKFAAPLDKETYPYGFNKDDFTLDYAPEKTYYRTKVFDGSYSIDGRTLVFATMLGYDGEIDYQVIGSAAIYEDHTYRTVSHNGETYSAPRFYDADEYMHVNVMEITLRMGDFVNNDVNMLVDEVRRCIDEKGNESIKITGLLQGKYYEYTVSDESLIPVGGIKRGDIIRAARSGNKVYRIIKTFSFSDPVFTFTDTSEAAGVSSGYSVACGYLYSNDSANINLYKPDGWNNGNLVLVTPTRSNENMDVAIYDTRTNKVYAGSVNDLYQNCTPQADGTLDVDEKSTKIFISRRYGYVTGIFAVYY